MDGNNFWFDTTGVDGSGCEFPGCNKAAFGKFVYDGNYRMVTLGLFCNECVDRAIDEFVMKLKGMQ
jgi:hypothetical protein